MEPYLKNQVAFVTGGSRGIGKAVALRLAKAGAKVAICARNRESMDTALAEFREFTPRVMGVCADISNSTDVDACVGEIIQQWGQIDILINNAGIYQPGSITDTETQMWDSQFDINLKGPFLTTHAVVPGMIGRKTGTIIFISSIAAVISMPNHTCYAATKWGLDGFAGCIAQELVEHGIKVHVLRPGFTETSIFDAIGGKPDIDIDWLQPDEIAGAVEFFLQLPKHAQVPELNYTTTSHRKDY